MSESMNLDRLVGSEWRARDHPLQLCRIAGEPETPFLLLPGTSRGERVALAHEFLHHCDLAVSSVTLCSGTSAGISISMLFTMRSAFLNVVR